MGCSDINECAVLNGGCEHLCTNKNGGFDCGCFDGYYMNDVGQCVSVDQKWNAEIEGMVLNLLYYSFTLHILEVFTSCLYIMKNHFTPLEA